MCKVGINAGVDFSENSLLVINDIIFRVLLLVVICCGFSAKVVNLETAFRYDELEDKIYVECPFSMKDVEKNECIFFGKCVYS